MESDYFSFFGLPVSFQVDEAALKRQFYRNSKQYHPDFHSQADAADQAEMLELSTKNNEAFVTLSDPDKRIRYVLGLKGLLGDEKNAPALPQFFLMEMMDLNEALMELEFDFDQKQYDRAIQMLENQENSLEVEIRPALENWTDQQLENDPVLLSVREYFLKKRYLLRIRENLSKFAPA